MQQITETLKLELVKNEDEGRFHLYAGDIYVGKMSKDSTTFDVFNTSVVQDMFAAIAENMLDEHEEKE